MGTTAQKLNKIIETKDDLKTAINYTGANITNQTTFKEYPYKLKKAYINILNNGTDDLYNALPKTTGVGTSITLDTEEARMNNSLQPSELSQSETPTPSNPVTINVIKGFNNIKIANSDDSESQNIALNLSSNNLFDFNNISVSKLGTTGEASVSNNKIIFSATNQQVYGVIVDLAGLHLKNNTTYTISNLMTNTGDFAAKAKGWRYYNGSTYTNMNAYTNYFTFTTTTSGTNQLFYYVGSPILYTGTLTIFNIQLFEGEIAEENLPGYMPYMTEPFEFCKIGDYEDLFFKNTVDSPYYDSNLVENEWYLKKNINKVVLNGTENWLQYESNVYATNIFPAGISDSLVINGYCNKCLTNIDTNMCYNSSFHNGLIIYNLISFWSLSDTTPTTWKTYLANNNLILYYPLDTPTYTQITSDYYVGLSNGLENIYNNAKSYESETVITQTNEGLPFIINASAIKSLD